MVSVICSDWLQSRKRENREYRTHQKEKGTVICLLIIILVLFLKFYSQELQFAGQDNGVFISNVNHTRINSQNLFRISQCLTSTNALKQNG